MTNMDELFYKLPLIGKSVRYLYTYFKKNIAFTNFIHVSLGLGIGLIIAGNNWFLVGIILLIISLGGHIYAYIQGRNLVRNEEY